MGFVESFKDEVNFLFSGKGMPYEKVCLTVAMIVSVVLSVLLAGNFAKDGVTKRKKPRRVVEVRPENRVTIARVIVGHKVHLCTIVPQSNPLIHSFFVKSDFSLVSVDGTDKGGLGKSS